MAAAVAPLFAQSWPQGPGCTTATMIDWDCDGYGPGSPLGPDADDNDPAVNTAASAIQRYGSTQALLAHLGYSPRRMLFIAPGGNDSTGQPGDETRPYRTWAGVVSLLTAGDAVIWRAGTYADGAYIPVSGTPANPIILMAYPGEKVILDQQPNGIAFISQNNIVLDGLLLQNSIDGYGDGIFFGDPAANIVIRNMEVRNRSRGILGMNGLSNVLIERNVFHDTTLEHGIYLGAREKPNSDIVVRYNVIYRAAYNGFQHNGRVTNLVVDSNIIHTNYLSALSFLEGVSNSFVRNNLMFGNGRNCMLIWDYVDSSPGILPYDQTNDSFVNNTCWVGAMDNTGAVIAEPAINIDDGGLPVSMNNHRFENNIFVTQNYAVFQFSKPQFWSTATVRNNLMLSAAGSPYLLNAGAPYSFAALNSWDSLKGGNVSADPQFRAVKTAWYNQPGNYDFTLQPGSPARGLAIAADAPGTDLALVSRGSAPDAGAFQISGGSSSGVKPAALVCTVTTLGPGASTACTVTLNGPAPVGGIPVALASSTPAVVVPAFASVAAGATSASFTALAASIVSVSTASISASVGVNSVSATLTLSSSGGAPVALLGLTCSAFELAANGSTDCTVKLSQPAPASGASIALSSSTSVLGLPPSVTIPAGSSSASFAVVAGSTSSGTTATITASYAQSTLTASLLLDGPPGPEDQSPGHTPTGSSPDGTSRNPKGGRTLGHLR